jgi:hypothetical protein
MHGMPMQEVKEFAESIHGQAASKGDPDAPKCESCHGSIHSVKAASEPVPGHKSGKLQ